jgi:ribosomal protein S18 acetylase RimI-like enzyme
VFHKNQGYEKEMKLDRFLLITPVKRNQFLLFGLRVFDFFKTSENENILLLGIPKVANCLILIPYIFKIGLLNLKRKRYFVKLGKYLVATFSIAEYKESIHIYSLTVDPKWRKRGIATYILNFLEAKARYANKNWLELAVHKTNGSAIQFYKNFGFVRIDESKWFIHLKKIVRNR